MSTTFKVFVASPGDTSKERNLLDSVIDEINTSDGTSKNYRLDLLRWEKDAYPDGGRPQAVINQQLRDYDIFIGIMWKRFGTPSGEADSGTEEEFNIAFEKWKREKINLMFYFSNDSYFLATEDEADQVKKVLSFRKSLNSKALAWDYPNSKEFKEIIKKHLCALMNDKIKGSGFPKAQANPQEIEIFRDAWDRMSPDLKKAFSIAYNENRFVGDGGIKTKDLFAALQRTSASELKPFIEEIPQAALPNPTAGEVLVNPYVIEENPWLSHCVSSSLRRLVTQLPKEETITAMDIFIDIAKNGTGESVKLLRDNNIGPKEIEFILKKKNIKVNKLNR